MTIRQRVVAGVTCMIALSGAVAAPMPEVRAQDMKVGFVDMAALFDGYERTKQSESVLERKGQQKESELQGRLDELKKMRQGLDLLNDQAREARSRELERKADELRRFGSNTKEDLLRERDQLAGDIIKEIQATLKEFGKTNAFTLILDKGTLAYAPEAIDVTDDVLKHLNQRYASKAGAKAASAAR